MKGLLLSAVLVLFGFLLNGQIPDQTVAGIVPDAPLPVERLSEQLTPADGQPASSPWLWGPQRSADPNIARYSPFMRANPLIYGGYFNVNRPDYPGGRRLGLLSSTTLGIMATGNVYPLVANQRLGEQGGASPDERAAAYYQNRRADDFEPYLPDEPRSSPAPYDPYTDPTNPFYSPWRNSPYGPYGPMANRMWGNPFYNGYMMDPFYSPFGYGSMYGNPFWPSMGLGIGMGAGGFWPSMGIGFTPFNAGLGFSGMNPALGYNYFDTTYRHWR